MSATPTTPSPSQLDPQQYSEYLKAQIAQQSNTTGLTQLAPSTQGASMPVHMRAPAPGAQQNQAFGPGQGGANKRQSMQNLVNSVKGVAQQFSQYAEQKQQRQYEQTISRFTGATQGLQAAQAQQQQGQQMLAKAAEMLKQNPNDPQAHQLVQQGQMLSQQAAQAMQQNKAILNDMANDSKSHKIITKAFGIDDKNAGSPERMAAQQVLQKQMGVGQGAAGILSQLPQTQQLSPEAQQQEMARKAGVVGAPATGGQQLAAETRLSTTATTEQGRMQRADAKLQMTAAMNGQKYDDSGKLVPMTPDEIAKSPILSAKVGVQNSRQQVNQAMAELDKAKASAVPEQIKLAEAKVAVAQGNLMMRQKEFGIKVADEERKQLETTSKVGDMGTVTGTDGTKIDITPVTGGRPLQSWAQQTVVQTQDRIRMVQDLMQKLQPIKDNNTPGYLAGDRLAYAMGMGGENGQLASEVSNIELQRVVNAAGVLKGSSRAYSALAAAMIHTPNAWTDSPKLMYQKLTTILDNLNGMQTDAINYGQKNQRANEMPGQQKPKAAAPSGAKPDKAVDDFLLNLK